LLKLLLRKSLTLILILPILHAAGFYYALIHPRFSTVLNSRSGQTRETNYFNYLRSIFTAGDFGTVGGARIDQLLLNAFANSLLLIFLAMLIATIGGLLLGFLAIRRKSLTGWSSLMFAIIAGSSLPGFLLGGAFITIFVYLLLNGSIPSMPLPFSGCGSRWPIPFGSCGISKHLVLPLIVLAIRPMLQIARITVGLLEEELALPHIQAARGRGLRWQRVKWKHAFRGVLAQVITALNQSFRYIVSGVLIVEVMFLWPGIGRFFVYATVANDNLTGQFRFFAHPQLIASIVFLLGVIILSADLVSAIAVYLVDPRIRE
jgi:peptide/nickel transport system permease protein